MSEGDNSSGKSWSAVSADRFPVNTIVCQASNSGLNDGIVIEASNGVIGRMLSMPDAYPVIVIMRFCDVFPMRALIMSPWYRHIPSGGLVLP